MESNRLSCLEMENLKSSGRKGEDGEGKMASEGSEIRSKPKAFLGKGLQWPCSTHTDSEGLRGLAVVELARPV